MKIVICPDSFKGSLSSMDVALAAERGISKAISPDQCQTVLVPIADGGEGTVDALLLAAGGHKRYLRVHDPLMRPIDSYYGILGDGHTAVIEMATASGLCLLGENERNPLKTSTFGTGELIADAIRSGVTKIIIGIGGSATNDGGVGAMTALGARFLNASGCDINQGGASLADLDRIDMSHFMFPGSSVEVEVACDVTNPLCGANGASAVYGPQKGSTPEMVVELDAALSNYARVVACDLGTDVMHLPGAGAAGGLGAALAAFLHATLRSGIDIVLDTVNFNAVISDADLIITGEGRVDSQTANGKAIAGILKRAKMADKPVVAIGGSLSGDISVLYQMGLTAAYSITSGPMSIDHAMHNAASLVENACENIVRLFRKSQI